MHNTSESNFILLTITLVLRRKCKYNKVKSLYWTLSRLSMWRVNNIKNNWSVRESWKSWGRRAGPRSYCRCPRWRGHRHQHGVQPLVRLDPSLHLQISDIAAPTSSNFLIIALKTFLDHKLLIILILVTRQQRTGRCRRAYSCAVADKQRRKKSVLYRRCECASCRSRSRPVSDVWRHLDSSYSHSRPHHGRRQEWRWQL